MTTTSTALYNVNELPDDDAIGNSRASGSIPSKSSGSFWKRLFGSGTPAPAKSSDKDSVQPRLAAGSAADQSTASVSPDSAVPAHQTEPSVAVEGEMKKADEPVPQENRASATADEITTSACRGGMLLIAASQGETEATASLLAQGADVAATDFHGRTPLHRAVLFGSKEVAELLLAHGANVNARNAFGVTPLHTAASFGMKELAELLMARGADVNAPDHHGDTPLGNALARSQEETAEFLRRNGAAEPALREQAPLVTIVQFGVAENTDEHQADVDSEGKSEEQEQHCARAMSREEIRARRLARRKASRAAKRDAGTPDSDALSTLAA